MRRRGGRESRLGHCHVLYYSIFCSIKFHVGVCAVGIFANLLIATPYNECRDSQRYVQ